MSSPDYTPTKQCSKCRELKPVTLFARNRSTFDGLQNQCKECRAAGYRAQKERGGPKERTTDNTITPGNPLSDLDTAAGRARAEDICWAVAGRVIKQQGGVRFLDEGITDHDIQKRAMEWVLWHRAEASRIEKPGTAVVKIAERISRWERGEFRNPEGIAVLGRGGSRGGKRSLGYGPDTWEQVRE